MTRLLKLNQAEMSSRQKEVYEVILSGPRGRVHGPLAIWLHRANLADKAQALGQYCRYETSLPAHLSELAILTTACIWDAKFEWHAHVSPALAAGLDPAIIDALAVDKLPMFNSSEEALVYEFTKELNLKRSVSDELYTRSVVILGEGGVVDLVGVLGYYSLISMTIKVFDIDPKDVEEE